MVKEDLKTEQLRLESISEEYRKDANRTISELPKHLILTSTVFIALSSSILGINNIPNRLSIFDKWFLIGGLGLMVFSILMGLLQYLVDYCFFKSQVDSKEKIIKLIADESFETFEEYSNFVRKESEKLKLGSSNIPFIFQCIFILLGITAYIFVIYDFLLCSFL